jgi:hypothetical protein
MGYNHNTTISWYGSGLSMKFSILDMFEMVIQLNIMM